LRWWRLRQCVRGNTPPQLRCGELGRAWCLRVISDSIKRCVCERARVCVYVEREIEREGGGGSSSIVMGESHDERVIA
jgi:hypothetical protein